MSSTTVGVIFYSFKDNKVVQDRVAYSQGMSVPETAVAHRFIHSRGEASVGSPSTYTNFTFYSAPSSLDDFLKSNPQFDGVRNMNYVGVILGKEPKEFIAVRNVDEVLTAKPTTI